MADAIDLWIGCQLVVLRVETYVDVDPYEALFVGENGDPGSGDTEDVLAPRKKVLHQAGDFVAISPSEGAAAGTVVNFGVKLEP